MSASSKVPVETGAIAHVNFRVRCEKLGYGEDVYLIQDDDTKMQKVRRRNSVLLLLLLLLLLLVLLY